MEPQTVEKLAKRHGCVENSDKWYKFNTIHKARDFSNALWSNLYIVGAIHVRSNTVFIKGE